MLFKNKKKFFSRSKIIIFIGLAVLVVFLIGLTREIFNRYQINQQVAKLEKEISQLEKENSQISRLISSWSESSRLEKEARLKLGLQKPGEKAVLIIKDATSTPAGPVLGPNAEVMGNVVIQKDEKESNLVKWWQYFFNKT